MRKQTKQEMKLSKNFSPENSGRRFFFTALRALSEKSQPQQWKSKAVTRKLNVDIAIVITVLLVWSLIRRRSNTMVEMRENMGYDWNKRIHELVSLIEI